MTEPTPDAQDADGGGLPLPGMPDLGGLLDSLNSLQAARVQVYEGHAGGGMVTVRASGDMSFESVSIRPEAVDPEDVGMLEDLVLAALHDLTARLLEAQQAAMGALGGLDIGGLLGGGAIDADSSE